MFQFSEFCYTLQKLLPSFFPETAVIRYESVSDPGNKIKLLSVSIGPDSPATVFNLTELYATYMKGSDIYSVACRIRDTFLTGQGPGDLPADSFRNFEKLSAHIFFRLLPSAAAAGARLVSRPYLDLSLTYAVNIREDYPLGISAVTHTDCERWRITEKDLYDIAVRNTPRQHPLSFFRLDTPDHAPSGASELYVLTNRSGHYGASVLLYPGVLSQIYDILGCFYILPTSVHEILAVSAAYYSSDIAVKLFYRRIQCSINSIDKVLSSSVYYSDGQNLTLI